MGWELPKRFHSQRTVNSWGLPVNHHSQDLSLFDSTQNSVKTALSSGERVQNYQENLSNIAAARGNENSWDKQEVDPKT